MIVGDLPVAVARFQYEVVDGRIHLFISRMGVLPAYRKKMLSKVALEKIVEQVMQRTNVSQIGLLRYVAFPNTSLVQRLTEANFTVRPEYTTAIIVLECVYPVCRLVEDTLSDHLSVCL